MKANVTRTQRSRGECTYGQQLDPVHWLKCSTNRTLNCSARKTTATWCWPRWTSRWWSWFPSPCTEFFHLLPEMFCSWKKSQSDLGTALPAVEQRWDTTTERTFSALTPKDTWCCDSKLSGWSPRGRVQLAEQSSSHSSSRGSQWAAVGILSRKVRRQKGFISTSSRSNWMCSERK